MPTVKQHSLVYVFKGSTSKEAHPMILQNTHCWVDAGHLPEPIAALVDLQDLLVALPGTLTKGGRFDLQEQARWTLCYYAVDVCQGSCNLADI